MRTKTVAAALLAALALVAAGCGDSGSTTTTGGQAATTVAGAAADIETVAVDFAFDPDEWTVQAGSGRTIEIDNQGTLLHNFVILSSPIENESDLTEDLVLFRLNAEAGQKVTGTIEADLAPGTYQVICDIAGHFSAGMVAELTVTG